MQGPPQLNLNTQIKTRSASGVSQIKNEATKTSASKDQSTVSKFLTKVGNFFRNIFGFKSKQNKNVSTVQANTTSRTNSVISKKVSLEIKVDPKTKKVELLNESIKKLNTSGIKGDQKVDSLIQQYKNFDIKNMSLEELSSFQKKINIEVSKHTKANISNLKKSVDESISRFVKHTHSKYQEKMAPIQKTMKQRINTLQAKRDMKTELKTDLNIQESEVDAKYQKLLDLYTEKELKTSFTTSIGTVYDHLDPSKQDLGWAGRSNSEIDSDINSLLNSNQELKQKYDKKLGDLFKGVSKDIKKETDLLIESVKENDKVMANIKAVQISLNSIESTEEGISKAINKLDNQDSNVNLTKYIELNTITDNMKSFSKAYIEGFHNQTHVSSSNIKDKVADVAENNETFKSLMPSDQQSFIDEVTKYITNRYEQKGIIQLQGKQHYSINTSNQENFTLKSKKDSVKKSFPKLFDSTQSTGMFSARTITAQYSEQFSNIESSLENKIKIKTGTITKDELESMIVNSMKDNNMTVDDSFVSYLKDYTMDRLEEKKVVSYADAGSVLKAEKDVDIESKKTDFKQSLIQTNPAFKKLFSEIKDDLSYEVKNLVKTANESKGLTSKVELMTKKLTKSNSYITKTKTNVKVSTRLAFNKIKTASNPISELKSTVNDIKDSVNSIKDSFYENSALPPSASDAVNENAITHLESAENQINSINANVNNGIEKINNIKQSMSQIESGQQDEKATKFEKLSESLLKDTGITDIALGVLNGTTPTDDQLMQLKETSAKVLQTIDQMKSLVQEHADKADMIIEQIPHAGQIYSAAKILMHVSTAENKTTEINNLRKMVSTVNSGNIEQLFTDNDNRTDSFSNLLQAKDERTEVFADIVFSSINLASAPLGVSVGSAFKQVYNLNKAGTLSQDDYKQISKNIMTLNSNYHKMSTESKSITTHNFISHLKQGSIQDNWNEVTNSFFDYSLAGVDSSIVKDEILAS